MKHLRWGWAAWTVLIVVAIAPLRPAVAACHAFTVTATPDRIGEGGTVTVKVMRDAAVNPSQIDVSTVDESAQAGADYQELHRTVSFTNETQQTFSILIANDGTAEATETFRVELSNPSGCAVNSNFSVGPPARVTIDDDDQPATTTPSTAGSPGGTGSTSPAVPTTTPEATTTPPSTTSTTVATTTSSPATSPDVPTTVLTEQVATGDDAGDDDVSVVATALAVAAVLASSGSLAGYWWRRRLGGAA